MIAMLFKGEDCVCINQLLGVGAWTAHTSSTNYTVV